MQTGTSTRKKSSIPISLARIDMEKLVLDQRIYTYNDYKNLPEGAPYQLIGGSLVMTPSPEVYHQDISGKLAYKMRGFVIKNKLGFLYYAPIDVKLSKYNVFQPDVIFIRKKNKKIIGLKNICGAPDVVIEILSPSTAYYDLREKFRVYEKYGVKEYWIVDPKVKSIEIYENHKNKFLLNNSAEVTGKVSSGILKGFTVSLKEIF